MTIGSLGTSDRMASVLLIILALAIGIGCGVAIQGRVDVGEEVATPCP